MYQLMINLALLANNCGLYNNIIAIFTGWNHLTSRFLRTHNAPKPIFSMKLLTGMRKINGGICLFHIFMLILTQNVKTDFFNNSPKNIVNIITFNFKL